MKSKENGLPAAHEPVDQRHMRLILVAVTLIFMAVNADGPSFNLTVPTLQHEFHTSFFATQLMVNISQLAVAAFVLAAGTLGDIYGRRKWLLIGTVGLLVGYIIQSFAFNLTMILIARTLVGLSTALTIALTLAIVVHTFIGKESAKAIGIFAGAGSLAAALMPITTQWFNQTFGWRTSFLVPFLLGAAGLYMAWRYVVESRDPRPRKLDTIGVVLNAIGLGGIVYGFILIGSIGLQPITWASLIIGIIALGLFIWWEMRVPDPALKLSLFRNPVFSIAMLSGLVLNAVDFGMHPVWSTYLQSIQGHSPLAASIILLPWAMGAALISPAAGRWTARYSPRLLMTIGLAIAALATWAMTLLTGDSSVWLVVGILTPFALAYGLANVPRTTVLMGSVPGNESGAASAANSMSVEVGAALGMALFNSLVARYAVGNYRDLLRDAGLSGEQIQHAVDLLSEAFKGIVATHNVTLPAGAVSELVEGVKVAYTSAIGQAFIIGAILLAGSAILTWFGMRGKSSQALEEAGVDA